MTGIATEARGQNEPVLNVSRVATGLDRPIFATAAPGDPNRLFVLEQHTGNVRWFDVNTGQVAPQPVLQISNLSTGNEQGLLGLAFDPSYAENGFLYVNYTQSDGTTRVVRYTVDSSDSPVADPTSAYPILSFQQPQANHNAGWMSFGPDDGYLYIATGDGGGANDSGRGHTPGIGNAQDTTDNLLGKMLRIDVREDEFAGDDDRNYSIPDSNPFVGQAGDDELWAYGLRNPWRNAFDPVTGDFYIGDVGQREREEINFQPGSSQGGENYGWRLREGTIETPGVGGPKPNDYVPPIWDYPHDQTGGRSVTGGYVYRGPDPELYGTYFFADFISDRVWSFRYHDFSVEDFRSWEGAIEADKGSVFRVASFGEDSDRNLYIVSLDGSIFRVEGTEGIPSRGDLNSDQMVDAADIDLLTRMVRQNNQGGSFDLNADHQVDSADRLFWVQRLKGTTFGDADLNGVFDSRDLVAVFEQEEYEDDVMGNSTWSSGDWNGDGDFTSRDLVVAMITGGYQGDPPTANVPEPNGFALAVSLAVCLCHFSRRGSNERRG